MLLRRVVWGLCRHGQWRGAHTPANSAAIDSCMLGFECAWNLVIAFFMRSME